ncbi:MAG: SRPBCC family protein [Nitrososphaerota archaeon]|nr:SRPBCC family protein [Nitrososphaerota archaeon]
MPRIERSIEVEATTDRVWDIISDLDNEGEYWWGTKEVHNISCDGNVINRYIVQNFRNHKINQKVLLRPKDSIEIHYLKGLTEGVKTIKLESLGESRQKVTTVWDVRFPGIYRLLSSYLASHVLKGTVGALQRIKDAAEGRQIQEEPAKT